MLHSLIVLLRKNNVLYNIPCIDLWSTDTLTQNGKSERVKCAGCCILTSYIMKQNRIVQSAYSNAELVRSRKS
jgi:hypothetical protein